MFKTYRVPVLLRAIVAACSGWGAGVSAWTPGTYPPGNVDFTVAAQERNDVVSFWHGVYQASEGYQDRHGWSGNYTAASPYTGAEGTTAAIFISDVERRLNFVRALCQVPASARFNTAATVLVNASDATNLYHAGSTPPLIETTTKAAATQRAAYMIARTYGYNLNGVGYPPLGNASAGMSHAPLAGACVAWTTAAWNANYHGNLAIGFYGPGAVDAYMRENVSGLDHWNDAVGHRRWLLHPDSMDYATGDTPGSVDSSSGMMVRPPTNVLYVVPKTAELAAVTPGFVSYPAAGYFPAALNSGYWSLSYPGAGFDAASVTMTKATGEAVAVVIKARGGGYGDASLVWQVPSDCATTAVSADTTYHVTVAGITGAGVPPVHAYAVMLINPNQITSDQALFGPGAPSTTTPVTYQFMPPAKAEAIEVNCFKPVGTAWTEGAEDAPMPRVLASTAASYAFRSTCSFGNDPGFVPLAGAKSFRLTFPVWYDPRLNGVPEQSFVLERELLPGAAATLNFKYQRGYMTPATGLTLESSSDGGVTWLPLGAAITGRTDNQKDTASTATSYGLAASNVPIIVRFRFSVSPGSGFYADQPYNGYDYTAIPTGIFIDDITTSGCQWLELQKINELAGSATSFVFNSNTAGVYLTNELDLRLRLRTKLGNRWMPYGPMKSLILSTADLTSEPVFDPVAGAYAAGRAITLAGENGATLFYRLNAGAEISAASPVGVASVPADDSTLTLTAYAKMAGKADSAIITASYTRSQFMTWANSYFPGSTDSNIVGPTADPDHDGEINLTEYALGGNPNATADHAKVYYLTSDSGGVRKLLLTIAVRAGSAFAGSPSPTATRDGVTYTIQGSLELAGFASSVSLVPAVTNGLPDPPAGYEYRTFTLDASDGLPNNGFLRVRVSSAP
jgi:hypothetical protein